MLLWRKGNFFVAYKVVPENTQKKTFHAANSELQIRCIHRVTLTGMTYFKNFKVLGKLLL